MNQHWQYAIDDDDIGWLRLDYHGGSANVLSHAVLKELEARIGEIEGSPPTGLLLASGKPKGFIAGADVNEFLEIETREAAEAHILWVHSLFRRIESLPCPSAALIHGFCMGGGLELALSCRYRIASDDPTTRLSFPEVRLGLFPGYGGSVRSMQRIGALKALAMMLSGRSLTARQARRQGLVDWAVPERQLLDAGVKILAEQPSPKVPDWTQRLANSTPLRPAVYWYFKRQTALRPYSPPSVTAANTG